MCIWNYINYIIKRDLYFYCLLKCTSHFYYIRHYMYNDLRIAQLVTITAKDLHS